MQTFAHALSNTASISICLHTKTFDMTCANISMAPAEINLARSRRFSKVWGLPVTLPSVIYIFAKSSPRL